MTVKKWEKEKIMRGDKTDAAEGEREEDKTEESK